MTTSLDERGEQIAPHKSTKNVLDDVRRSGLTSLLKVPVDGGGTSEAGGTKGRGHLEVSDTKLVTTSSIVDTESSALKIGRALSRLARIEGGSANGGKRGDNGEDESRRGQHYDRTMEDASSLLFRKGMPGRDGYGE